MNLSPTLFAVDIVPTRRFNLLYVILDSVFLLVLLGLLLWKRRRSNALFSLFGGILYTVVDFGIFYAATGMRVVRIGGEIAAAWPTFLVLLWMSMSYGFTNFCFMWSLMSKDRYAKYWVFLIMMWWMICPSLSSLGGEATIETSRTTGAYHAYNAMIMVANYLTLIVLLLREKGGKKPFVSLFWLLAIGISVQFSWEFALLVNGIRPLNEASIPTLIINSFLETNMCMPAIYGVYRLWSRFFEEDLRKKPSLPALKEEGAAE